MPTEAATSRPDRDAWGAAVRAALARGELPPPRPVGPPRSGDSVSAVRAAQRMGA